MSEDEDVQIEEVEEAAPVFKKPEPVLVNRLDHTIKGGRYITSDGTLRNAHGQLIDGNGKVLDGSVTPPPPKME